jgi:predicted transcriptional regulator
MIDQVEKEVNLLYRHLNVLNTVCADEPIGIVRTSEELRYPHHKVRYSLRILQEAELIEPTPNGAVPTEYAEEFLETFNDDLYAFIDRLDAMKIGGDHISRQTQ